MGKWEVNVSGLYDKQKKLKRIFVLSFWKIEIDLATHNKVH